MKKYIITSLLFFVSAVAMADDHCTNPNEYTIDRRCYVTDEQKTQKPYSAVARIDIEEIGAYCTGTIVKEKDGTPYLFTAKHCVYRPFLDGKSVDTVKIKLEKDNIEYEATKYACGNYFGSWKTYGGDWAVYKLSEDKKEDFLKIAVEKTNKSPNGKYSARLVGYGALKIMSDEEIRDFKQSYIEHLKRKKETVDFTADDNRGVSVSNEFLEQEMPNLIDDHTALKVSFCQYGPNNGIGCQGWFGNSGGPVFDDGGKIMAIVSRAGYSAIGGKDHADIIINAKFDNVPVKTSVKVNDIKLSNACE